MAKTQNSQKQTKKKALKTPAEKKAEKREKKSRWSFAFTVGCDTASPRPAKIAQCAGHEVSKGADHPLTRSPVSHSPRAFHAPWAFFIPSQAGARQ